MNEEEVAKEFLRRMIASYVTTAKVRQYLKTHHPAQLAHDPLLASRVQSKVRNIQI